MKRLVRIHEITLMRAINAFMAAQEKHGFDRTPANPNMSNGERLAILVEEVGEVARAMTYDADPEKLIDELSQTAAMTLAWIDGLTTRQQDEEATRRLFEVFEDPTP
jgi:hypothetical protein